jgi:hypothetical protein
MDKRESFIKLFNSFDVENDDLKDSLADTIKKESWEIPRLIVQRLDSRDPVEARKARALAVRIGDLATTPLLEESEQSGPDGIIWRMEQASDIHLKNESRIVSKLKHLLEDKRGLTPPILPPNVEEKPDKLRVCDKAYLIIRKMLSFENAQAEMLNSHEFQHNWNDQQRDSEIKRFMETGTWKSLVERISE